MSTGQVGSQPDYRQSANRRLAATFRLSTAATSCASLFLRWPWRHPCPVCERSCWPKYDGPLRQYARMTGARCPWRFHKRYARWST